MYMIPYSNVSRTLSAVRSWKAAKGVCRRVDAHRSTLKDSEHYAWYVSDSLWDFNDNRQARALISLCVPETVGHSSRMPLSAEELAGRRSAARLERAAGRFKKLKADGVPWDHNARDVGQRPTVTGHYVKVAVSRICMEAGRGLPRRPARTSR